MTQSRKHGSKRHSGEDSATRAGRRRQEAPASATPTMNERMRRGGKWVFLGLAIVEALGHFGVNRLADVYLAKAGAAISKAQAIYADAQAKGLVNGRSPVPAQVIPGQLQTADPFQSAASDKASSSSSTVMAEIGPLQTEATDAYAAAAAAA